jgi:hypothetical protein
MLVVITAYLALSFFGVGIPSLASNQSSDIIKARVEILRSVTEGIAIVIAGVWTYEVYIKNRYDHPYPKIQQSVKYYPLGNSFNYLSVFITVTNEGKTKLDLSSGVILVRKVIPLSGYIKSMMETSTVEDIRKGKNSRQDTKEKLFIDQSQRVGWPTLGERTWKENLRGNMHELEPGQTREIQFDFLFKDKVDVIEVISYFEFKKTGHWEHVTLHSLENT